MAFEDAGADLFARNNKGESLLHIAAAMEYATLDTHDLPVFRLRSPGEQDIAKADTFKFLMGKGLAPMVEDHDQRTALVSLALNVWSRC